MIALVFAGGKLILDRHRPEPTPAEGEAVVRVRQAGVCATDLEITRGYMGFEGVLGHEFVGEVDLCAARPELVGKRVVGEINCPCLACERCRGGLANHCARRTVLGILNRDGCFAEKLVLPADNLHVVPDGVDDDAAVFAEPLAAAHQVTRQVGVDANALVTVVGDGRLGLLCAQVLRNAGAPVRVLGRHAAKLGLCEKWGVKSRLVGEVTPRADQDVVVDCTGSAEGLELALRLVRPRGTVVLKSTFAAGKALNLAPVVIDEVTIVGSRCGPFREALASLANGSVDVASLVQRRFKLADGVAAMEYAGRPGVLKVLLAP